MVKLLLKAGADPDVKDYDDHKARDFWRLREKCPAMIKLLDDASAQRRR
jgi:hypothetical protein